MPDQEGSMAKARGFPGDSSALSRNSPVIRHAGSRESWENIPSRYAECLCLGFHYGADGGEEAWRLGLRHLNMGLIIINLQVSPVKMALLLASSRIHLPPSTSQQRRDQWSRMEDFVGAALTNGW